MSELWEGREDEGGEEAMSLETLLKAWDRTTSMERDRGRAFYWEAADLCRRWAREFGLQDRQVAGMMAALSPNNSWQNNKASCRAVLEGRDHDVRSYRRDLLKALWILEGAHPARVLQGPKTYNFYLPDGGSLV